jgi:hypothetical protein
MTSIEVSARMRPFAGNRRRVRHLLMIVMVS